MILTGSQRGGAKALGDHLLKTTENEHVEVHEVRGFLASDLLGALREAEATAKGTRCKQFMFSVSLNPPLVLWSLVNHSPSMQAFQDASHFCINVLRQDQSDIALHFARPSEDKFAGMTWQPGLGGAPKLDGVLAQFECRNSYRYYGGDHVIFLGAVEAYNHHQGDPLLFSRGAFGAFANLV